MKFALIL